MLGEDVDIGFYAEDAYAAYVVHVATHLGIVPDFSNARGASVDAIFTGPFLTCPKFMEAADALLQTPPPPTARGQPAWERVALQSHPRKAMGYVEDEEEEEATTVVLHAWIEKLNAGRKIQLMEPVHKLNTQGTATAAPAMDGDGARSGPSPQCSVHHDEREETAPAAVTHRVLGSLDYLLHLSTYDLVMGESNASQETQRLAKYASLHDESDSAVSEEAQAALAFRDALERRDDVAVARNAVETVIKFAQLAEEHPGAVATVYVNERGDEEELRFESAEA